MSRELTPRQHAAIRLQMTLIPVYVWALYGWPKFLSRFPLSPTGVGNISDFMHFYVQGYIANAHDAGALYDRAAHAALLAKVIPGSNDLRYPPVYGPQVAAFFAPLARLSYNNANYTWLLITFLVYGLCGWALWRRSARLREWKGTTLVLLLAAPALNFDLGFAQAAVIGLACVTASFLFFRSSRQFLAGVAVGALTYKPQLGLVAAFVFVFAGEWRVVAGAVLSGATQLLGGCLYWGFPILVPYLRTLASLPTVANDMEPFKFQMHSWRAFFDLLGLSPRAATIAFAVAAAATAVLALKSWRAGGSLRLRYSVLLLASALVNPHLYVYDLLLLVPALLLLWDWVLDQPDRPLGEVIPLLSARPAGRLSFRVTFCALLAVCYFSPLLGATAIHTHVQISVLAHATLLVWLVRIQTLPSPSTIRPYSQPILVDQTVQ